MSRLVLIGVGRCVLARAAELGQVPRDALVGKSRLQALAELRFAVMLVLAERGWSMSRIGTLLGGRDHSSISHGCARARGMLADEDFLWLVAALREAARAAVVEQQGAVPAAMLARFVKREAPPALDAEEIELARFGARMAEGSRALAAALSEYRSPAS